MAEKTINTRILLKYDTYANWIENNPVLKAGEVAFATIASGATQEVNSVLAPQVLIKVGDGTTAYKNLPFASARAADVYSWAKAETKPTYSASEITGLSDYIAGEIEDTDTQYQVVKGADDYTYKLQSKAKGGTAWTDVSTITIPKYDDSGVKADISALETLVGETAVATQIANAIAALKLADTYEPKGTGATEAGKVQTALNNYKTSNDAVIAAIKDGTNIDSFKDVETALSGKADSTAVYTKTAGEALATRVTTAEGKIDTLNGTGAGSVKKTVDDAINDFATKVSEDGTVNTFKELIDYAASHSSEFTELVGEVAKKANNSDLAAIAKSGNVNDLVQTSGDVLIFNCGDSTNCGA